MNHRHLMLSAVCLVSTVSLAPAATQYFSYTGTRNSWGGANWAASSGGAYTGAWGGYNDAVLEGVGGTVSGGNAVNKWTFNADGYVLTGGFTMGSPGSANFIIPNAAHTATISGDLSYANSSNILWKDGAGKLVLGGTNSAYKLVAEQGVLEINGGTTTVPTGTNGLVIGADSFQAATTKLGALTISGGALNINGGNFLVGQTVNGTATVAQFTQTAGSFNFSGGGFMGIANGGGVSQFDLSGGSFTSTSNMALGVRGNATVNISGSAQVTLPTLQFFFSDAVTGSGKTSTVNLDGGSFAVNSITRASNLSTSVLNLNGGTLKALSNNANFINASTLSVKVGGAVIDSNNFTIGIAQPLLDGGGGGGFFKNGAGTVTLSGSNTYTGATTVNAGTLTANNVSAFGVGAVLVNGGSITTTVPNLNTGALSVSSGTFSLNGLSVGTDTLNSGADFLMSGGQWSVSLAAGADQILGNGAGADFQITGGTIDLGGGPINYGLTYTLLSGFSSGSVSGLSLSGYDSDHYSATLGNDGVLSFSAVPEPGALSALLGGFAMLLGFRRRKAA